MASKKIFFAVSIASLLSLACAAPAFAQSQSEKEAARALMDEGDAKRDKGDLKAALAAYEKADAIMHVPTTGLEVAKTQAQLGMLLEARETLARVMRIPPKDKEPTAFVNARKAADQLNEELGKRVPSVQILISGLDAGQTPEVTIDKEPVAAATLGTPRKVNPGAHTIVAKAGGAEKSVDVTVAEKETKTVTIELKEKPAEPTKTVKLDTNDESSLPKVLTFGGFGLAVVGIGVGAVTGLMSMSKVDEIKGDCREDKCPQSRAGDIDSAKMLGNISTIGFAAAGVGVVVGVVGLVMMSGSHGKEAPAPGTSTKAQPLVKTQPVIGLGYMGLGGTF